MQEPDFIALVVDDDPVLRQMTMRALARQNFQCDGASNGVEASQKLAGVQYDVVVCDLAMPYKHGHQLAVEILSGPDRPALAILTAISEPRLEKDLRNRGVDAIVHKPVNFEKFAQGIRRIAEFHKARENPDHSDDLEPLEAPPAPEAASAVKNSADQWNFISHQSDNTIHSPSTELDVEYVEEMDRSAGTEISGMTKGISSTLEMPQNTNPRKSNQHSTGLTIEYPPSITATYANPTTSKTALIPASMGQADSGSAASSETNEELPAGSPVQSVHRIIRHYTSTGGKSAHTWQFPRMTGLVWIVGIYLLAQVLIQFVELRQHTQTIQTLRELGIKVISDGDRVVVNMQGKEVDQLIHLLQEVKNLHRLSLSGSNVTDEQLTLLKQQNALETLQLDHTTITDAGLSQLEGLRSLRELNVTGTAVSNEKLNELQSKNPELKIIREDLPMNPK